MAVTRKGGRHPSVHAAIYFGVSAFALISAF